MNSTEAAVPSTDAATRVVAYEQPLNERMRNFLRLDFLYQQAVHHHTLPDPWSTRAAVTSLLEILAITQRGDIRSEVLKELERQMHHLSAFSSRPGVDSARLKLLLTKLHRMREELSSVGALFMQKLRDSEFLNAIKHRSTIPGGTCEFDLPDYTHWLNQPDEIRGADFANWLAVIRPLGDSISELLWMTREQGRTRREVAANGIYHLTLERDVPVQLIRIVLPRGTDILAGCEHAPDADVGRCAVHARALHLTAGFEARAGRHADVSVSHVPAPGGMVGRGALAPVLQRALPAD
jgi:cell division protein ZapD